MRRGLGRAGVIVVLVAVFAGVLADTSAALGKQATPTATPPTVSGMREAANRVFEPAGNRDAGTISLAFMAGRFDSPDAATAAMPQLVDLAFFEFDRRVDSSGMRPASPPRLGDEAVAFAGPIGVEGAPEAMAFTAALLLVRDGPFVHLMIGVAINGDPVMDLVDVAHRVVGRRPSSATPAVGSDGTRTGGIWDILPLLDDLPPGFVLDRDSDLPGAPATPIGEAVTTDARYGGRVPA